MDFRHKQASTTWLAYARMGDKQKAIDLLESIAVVGFPAPIANDPDLASLIGEPRFQALAKAAQQAAEPCKNAQANPEYRQLDFPVGGWNVYSGKQKVGESSVRLILKDCVVFENWSGLQGGDGKSFNKYDLNRLQPASLALNETSTVMLAVRCCHLQV